MATIRTRPAGLLLEAALRINEMSQRDAATRIGRHNTLIQAIVEGRCRVTPDVAARLEELDPTLLDCRRILLLEADFDLFQRGVLDQGAAPAGTEMVTGLFGAIRGNGPPSARVVGVLTSDTGLSGSLDLSKGRAGFSFRRLAIRGFEIGIQGSGKTIDMRPGLSLNLQQNMGQTPVDGNSGNCQVVRMTPAEVLLLRRVLAEQVHPTPVEQLDAIPMIDPWKHHRGMLLPRPQVEKALGDNAECNVSSCWSPNMTQFKTDCPKTHSLAERICRNGHSMIDELSIWEYDKSDDASGPASLKLLYGLLDAAHKDRPRPQSLDDNDVEQFVRSYADKIASKHFAKLREPDVHHSDEYTLAVEPVSGQSEDAGCIFLLCYVSHSTGGWAKMEANIHNEHRLLSSEFIREMGLVYPKKR